MSISVPPAVGWSVVLDPSTVAISPPRVRTPLDLNSGPIRVDQKGIDWGDAQIQTYMADRRVGSIKIDFRMPNRKVVIPLFLGADESGSEEEARMMLQQKVGLLQTEGGWIGRQRLDGPMMYADVVDAILTLPDVWGETGGVEPNVNLILECAPDFYGDEITLDTMTHTTQDPFLGSPFAAVITDNGKPAVFEGDWESRVSISVTDSSGVDQGSMLWGLRAKYHDSAATAKLSYAAYMLQPVSPQASSIFSTQGGTTGAIAAQCPNGAGIAAIPLFATMTPVLGTDYLGTSPLTHQGSYRVKARVYSTSVQNVWLQFVWGIGAAVGLVTNSLVQVPGQNNWYIIDLGEVRLDAAPIGTHRWQGQIQAMSAVTNNAMLVIAEVWFQPLDDAAGILVYNSTATGLSGPVAKDALGGSSGSLNGKAATLGGSWVETTTTDPLFQEGAISTTRSAATSAPHFARLGPQLTDTDVQAWVGVADEVHPIYCGVMARWIDATHWVALYLYSPGDETYAFQLGVMIANGTVPTSFVTSVGVSTYGAAPVPAMWPIRMVISSGGVLKAWYSDLQVLSYTSTLLASGGALAQGYAGISDYTNGATTRYWSNFALAPGNTTDAVMYGHSSLDLRYNGMFRSDVTNTYFGPVAKVIGDQPRVPPSGIEKRPVELFLRPSRGDLGSLPDPSGTDSYSVSVKYRPCWLHRP